MKQNHQFSNLLKGIAPNDCLPQKVIRKRITDSQKEAIDIYIAQYSQQMYAPGYVICWAKGGSSAKEAQKANGYCSSEKDAMLYILGEINSFSHLLLPDTAKAVSDKIESLMTVNSLFD